MAKYDLFISYSRRDFEEVSALKKLLETRIPGIKIWFDITGIESGDEFDTKIISAIDSSEYIIFALSDNSIESNWSRMEIMYAKNTDKRVIPVLLKGAKMKGWFLFQFGRIDCIDSSNNLQIEKLIGNLSSWLNITPKKLSSIVQPKQESPFTLDFNVKGVNFRMIKVEGGTFTMGATSEQGPDAFNREKPAHKVTLSDYYIGQFQVTQELWEAVMGSNPSFFKNPKNPVENISWDDVVNDFLPKLNALTGKTFTLPTEAQWEFAARGGNKSKGYKYSGSNNHDEVAWYDENSNRETHPVGQKFPNELGVYDMSGNVEEWCSDWYGDYSAEAQTDPTGPVSGSDRVLHGGNYYNYARYSRVSYRYYYSPDYWNGSIGFRLAMSL